MTVSGAKTMKNWNCRSSKSLLANVLDIDDDFRCNHRCNTLPHNPTYYRTVYRQGEDGSIGPVGGGQGVGGRIHETVSHTCLSSSAEYELALILKELRVITDVVRYYTFTYTFSLLAFIQQTITLIFPLDEYYGFICSLLFPLFVRLLLAINFMHYLTESEYFIAFHFALAAFLKESAGAQQKLRLQKKRRKFNFKLSVFYGARKKMKATEMNLYCCQLGIFLRRVTHNMEHESFLLSFSEEAFNASENTLELVFYSWSKSYRLSLFEASTFPILQNRPAILLS